MKCYVSALLVLVPATCLAALVGCAEGAEADATEAYLATTPADGGKDENKATLPPPSNPSKGETDAGSSDAGADSGPKDGGDGGNGGGGVACTSPNVCSGAVNLGEVRGDEGSDA